MVLGVSGVPAMPRPSESTHGIADIGLLAAVLVGLWIGKELVLQVAVVGSLDLLAAGVTLLTIGLGRRVLAPLAAGRSARRRNAHIAALRDRFCAPDNDRFLPMNRPWIAGAGSGDPPRPFDPQAAATFLRLLEFEDPYAALRCAGLRECDVLAWLAAGLERAPEGDPRRDFAMQAMEFLRSRRGRRRPMLAGEPRAPMPDGAARPERPRDEMIVT